jgi:hypothetical protein
VAPEGFLRRDAFRPRASVHSPKARHRRAEHAGRAYFSRLALTLAKARRARRSGGAAA